MNFAKRIRGFFWSIYRSCFDVAYYRSVRKTPLKQHIGYVFGFLFVSAILSMLFILPGVIDSYRSVTTNFISALPDDVVFEMRDQKLETNLDEVIDMEEEPFSLVIDTSFEGEESPLAFVGRTGLFIGANASFFQVGQESEVFDYDGEDFTLTKGDIEKRIRTHGPWMLVLGYLIFFIPLYLALITESFVFVALGLLVVIVFARFSKIQLSYKQWFATGLHAITLPLLVDIISPAFGLAIPYAYPVIFFLIMFSVMTDEKNSPVKLRKHRRAK